MNDERKVVEFIANLSRKYARSVLIGGGGTDFVIKATVEQLNKLFGRYGKGDPYKQRAVWDLLFFVGEKVNGYVDGKFVPISIYDYKNFDTPLRKMKKWDVGGHESDMYGISAIVVWINSKINQDKQQDETKK